MEQAERAYHEALNLARGSKLTRAMKDALEYKTDYLRHLLSEYRKQRVIFKLESVGVCSNKRSAA